MHAYLFFGLAGSGKGTQRELLEKLFAEKKMPALSLETGQLLREYTAETDLPAKRLLAEVMRSGGLVPSAFPITMWVNGIMNRREPYEFLLFDGAGRKLVEAQVLVDLLSFFRNVHIHVLYLRISEAEAKKRLLKRNRVDDTEDAIQTRFLLFHDADTGTAASIQFLLRCPNVLFHDIDGVGAVQEVHERILPHIAL